MVNRGRRFFIYCVCNCMVYHVIHVSKHRSMPWFPWYIMVFYHGLPVSKYHGILPWHTMVYIGKGSVRKRMVSVRQRVDSAHLCSVRASPPVSGIIHRLFERRPSFTRLSLSVIVVSRNLSSSAAWRCSVGRCTVRRVIHVHY